MKLELQEVQIWVSADEEPQQYASYLCRIKTKYGIEEMMVEFTGYDVEIGRGRWYYEGLKFTGEKEVLQWSKPVNIYALTESDLTELITSAIKQGRLTYTVPTEDVVNNFLISVKQ